MKKLFLIAVLALGIMFVAGGCSPEWYKHDTVYKTNDHMTFSWWGYNNPTDEDLKQSNEEGWWGDAIPYIPAE